MKFEVRKMSRRRSRPAPEPPNTPGAPTCCFCGFSEDDEVEYGKLWNQDGIVTHYYCLLLSSNMEQNGNDNEGILGFMTTDIQKELRRGKRLFCSYCRRAGATLGCCNTRCKRVFHLPCGLRAGSLHQFYGEFRSFCINHRIKQEIDEHIKQEAAAAGVVTCYICYEEVNPQNTVRTLWAPCCRKNAWFHRKCVQRLALSAGYFFKCPLCNNKQEFQKAMLEHGIFIPHQDASWELVPNAYQELLHRHSRCDASECLCPKGRSHTSVNAKWELVLCRLCGSQGVHKACGHLKWANSVWECAECVGMLRKTTEDAPRGADQTKKATSEITHDESSSDSNISVGGNPSPLPITERPDSPPPITSSVKLRPGPRSFKLQQQAMQNAKSAEIARIAASNISVPENRDISLPSGSDINRDAVSSEKFESEVLRAGSSRVGQDSSLSESICIKRNGSISEEISVSVEEAGVKSIERKHPVAEVIMIDSDDEVEIINTAPKQNILTTNDGIQIPIHCLSQISAESHEAKGDVKVAESTCSDLSKPSSRQSKGSSAGNGSVQSDTSSLSLTYHPNSISTATPELHSSNSNIAKCPVTSGYTMGTGTQESFLNQEDTDSIVVRKVVQSNSVMNLKITNVTSLRHEEFSNSFEDPDVFRGSRGRSPSNRGQQVHIINATDPTSGSPKSSTTVIDLSMSANKKTHAKRKSKEYAEKNISTLPNREAVESCKKARVCESRNSGCAPQNADISWNITLEDVNRAIPTLMGSVPITCSSDTNRFRQSTTTLQLYELKTGGNDGVEPIYTPELYNRNGVRKNPRRGLASSYRRETPDSINNVNGESIRPLRAVSPVNFTRVPKITKTYGVKRLSPKSTGLNNSNVHGTTYSDQQSTVNGTQNLLETASALFKPQTLAQRIPSSSNSVSQTPHTVYQSPAIMNKEIQRYNMSGGTLQTNISTTVVPCVDNLPRNCEGTITGSNGNQPNTNNVSQTNHSIIQLANRIPFPSGCHGDAGSSLLAGAGVAHRTNSRNSVHESAEPIILIDPNAASGSSQTNDDNSSISTCVSANSTSIRTHSSPPTKRTFCDKPRLIPDNVPLRNLNFRVSDSGNVQIVVCDTFTLNISADTGNVRNTHNPAGPSSFVRKLQPLSPPSLSKFIVIGNDRVINISEECGLPYIRRCTSPKKSVKYPIISGSKFDNRGLSSSDTTITDSNIKACSVVEVKREIGSKLSRTKTEDQTKRENNCTQKMNSVTEISSTNEGTVRECFQSTGKNSLCLGHKENLFKEKRIGPASSNDGKNLQNLRERDKNIYSIGKRDGFSKNLNQTSAKQVKGENNTRSVSSVDFCSKSLNCMNDKSKEKLLNGLNRVSKCLMKSLDDSSALNLPVDCYTNSRRISELDCNIKDSDANLQDSSRNDGSNQSHSNAPNFNKHVDASNSNESIVQGNGEKHISNTSCPLFRCENVNSDVSMIKSTNSDLKDECYSRIDKNSFSCKGSMCGSGRSIKVRIDLTKIQHFIDSQPQFFTKRGNMKSKCLNKHVTESSQSYHHSDSDKRYCFSKVQTSQGVENSEDSQPRKKCKYNFELCEENATG